MNLSQIKIFAAVSIFFAAAIWGQTAALNALNTDGTDDYAYPITPNAAGIPEGTIEFWFSPDNWNGSEQMWGGGNGHPGTNGDWVRLGTHTFISGRILSFGRYSGGWNWAHSGLTPVAGNWYHVAATWGPGGLKIFINGNFTTQHNFSGDLHNYATELIGASSWGDFFDGAIDELRVWNVARDAGAIALTMNDTLGAEYYASADSGLIAYYRMDALEDLGANSDGADDLRDLSVNANHLDTAGNPSLTTSGAFMLTAIGDNQSNYADGYELHQNYPNPFNPTTTIEFALSHASRITLQVFDITGRKVKTLVDGNYSSGNQSVQWNGTNDAGQQVASGVYLYRLSVGKEYAKTRKLILMR